MDDIAITGLGAVTPLGTDVAAFTRRLFAGEVAIGPAPWSDPDAGDHVWAADIHDFDPSLTMDARVIDGTDLFAQYAIAAAAEAVADHGGEVDPMRTGVVLGASTSGARVLLDAQRRRDVDGPDAVPKKLNIQAWPNMAAGQVAMRWQLHGPLLTVCSACASSLDAIGHAGWMIERGDADVVIAGGTEHGLAETLYLSQRAYGMSRSVADPTRASMPFDVDRIGIVEGVGAGVVVLERGARARARGARIHGYLRGYASLSDAFHPSSPDPTGQWEALTMQRAIGAAGLTPADVDGIIAHGTATPLGDLAEITAINAVFGRREELLVSSIKGHVGHSGASAGVLGLIGALHGMDTGRFVHTANTRNVEPSATFTVVTGQPVAAEIDVLQVNGFGFGGQDASIVVTRA